MTSGRSRLSFGEVTVYTNSKTGSEYTKTNTYSGKAEELRARVETFHISGAGPASATSIVSNQQSVNSQTVNCKEQRDRKAVGFGSITYNGETQSANPSHEY